MIHVGDCLEVMKTLDAESIDAIVTDPPYGLSFMGKDWDTFKAGNIAMRRNPAMDAVNAGASRQGGRQRACSDYQKRQRRDMLAFQEAMASVFFEAIRVARPGTHLLAFGGTRTFHRLTVAIEDAGWEIRDCIMWVYGSGFPKSHNLNGEWQGWGTALKPAWEPIIVSRKPLAGTVAQNVQQYGTGAVNVDGCRIGGNGDHMRHGIIRRNQGVSGDHRNDGNGSGAYHKDAEFTATNSPLGRWPANLIHDGSDEVTGLMGSAARFFYCAKASKADRDSGPDGWETRGVHRYGAGIGEGVDPKAPSRDRNHHPTVKPNDLMRYLCRLVTPPGGVVLDPFCGSGSTGKAAAMEGFQFIGIELNPEYAAIAEARIRAEIDKTPLLEAIR